MKLLETTKRPDRNYFSNVRRAITTNISSLLTWTKMLLNVGCVIIVVAIFAGWFVVLGHLFNYSDGRNLQAATILRDLLSYLIDT